MKHVRLFVHVPITGKYCLVGRDIPEADVATVEEAVAAINLVLLGVLTVEVTDHA